MLIICQLLLRGSNSRASNSLNFICSAYNICKRNIAYNSINNVLRDVHECILRDNESAETATVIKDFVNMLEFNKLSFEDKTHVKDIVAYLCTS